MKKLLSIIALIASLTPFKAQGQSTIADAQACLPDGYETLRQASNYLQSGGQFEYHEGYTVRLDQPAIFAYACPVNGELKVSVEFEKLEDIPYDHYTYPYEYFSSVEGIKFRICTAHTVDVGNPNTCHETPKRVITDTNVLIYEHTFSRHYEAGEKYEVFVILLLKLKPHLADYQKPVARFRPVDTAIVTSTKTTWGMLKQRMLEQYK